MLGVNRGMNYTQILPPSSLATLFCEADQDLAYGGGNR